MSAQVFQLRPIPKKALELSEIIEQAADQLLEDWERMVRVGRINEYIKSALPLSTDDDTFILNDLNALARIEMNLNIQPMIFFPGTAYPEQFGWIVQTKLGDQHTRTPELANEASARAFGIMLHLKAKHEALNQGLSV